MIDILRILTLVFLLIASSANIVSFWFIRKTAVIRRRPTRLATAMIGVSIAITVTVLIILCVVASQAVSR